MYEALFPAMYSTAPATSFKILPLGLRQWIPLLLFLLKNCFTISFLVPLSPRIKHRYSLQDSHLAFPPACLHLLLGVIIHFNLYTWFLTLHPSPQLFTWVFSFQKKNSRSHYRKTNLGCNSLHLFWGLVRFYSHYIWEHYNVFSI